MSGYAIRMGQFEFTPLLAVGSIHSLVSTHGQSQCPLPFAAEPYSIPSQGEASTAGVHGRAANPHTWERNESINWLASLYPPSVLEFGVADSYRFDSVCPL